MDILMLVAASNLHVYETLAEGIGSLRKTFAGKGVAVSHTVGDLVGFGAGQNRAGLTEQMFLNLNFVLCFRADTGTAGRAGAHNLKLAHITVNSTGGGGHMLISFLCGGGEQFHSAVIRLISQVPREFF